MPVKATIDVVLLHDGRKTAAHRRRRLKDTTRRMGREAALLAALWAVYSGTRHLVGGRTAEAFANARALRHFEQWMGLPSEAKIQALGSERLWHAANLYYVGAHFPVTIAFLAAGLLLRPRREFAWARRLLVTQTALALLIQICLPLAPPRMFPQWGFVDTMTVYGPSAYAGAAASIANQFAAMPSLHVGWAALIAVVVCRTTVLHIDGRTYTHVPTVGRARLRRLGCVGLRVVAAAHALITTAVVIMTANHWWLDCAAGLALLGIALIIFPRPGGVRPTLIQPALSRRWRRADPT